MKYLSICSGIEAATVAWHPLKWSPAAFAEIESFPSAVLKHHYPHVPNFGDMTKFHEWPQLSIDILVGGTPCQAFSIAGLRAGLADPRGNLTLTFLALAGKHRPRWVVWENVPGVLSDRTNAFGHLLSGLAELGYGWAYRVLDAQYFGVPQRRRRVFVVGCLGDQRRAAEVLFERESLRGDPPPSRRTGERITGSLTKGSLDGSGACGGDGRESFFLPETVGALTDGAHQGGGGGSTAKMRTAEEYLPSVAWALQERDAKGADSSTKEGHLIPMIPRRGSDDGRIMAFGSKDSGGDLLFDVSPTLRSGNEGAGNQNGGVPPAIAFDLTQVTCPTNRANPKAGDPCHTIAKDSQPAIAFKPSHYTRGKDGAPSDVFPPLSKEADRGDQEAVIFESRFARNGRGAPDGIAPPLKAQSGETGKGDAAPLLQHGMQVRRLTPRECERLQGFPDDYTRIPYRKKPAADCPDGPRYKALGNSMAVPVMAWLGSRIALFS